MTDTNDLHELAALLDDKLDGVTTLSFGENHDGWNIQFELDPANGSAPTTAPSAQAWRDLEFLAWIAYGPLHERDIDVVAYANPPHLNDPGRMLRFELRGWRGEGPHAISPAQVIKQLQEAFKTLYVPGGAR
jgi:hypothetical protein